MASKLRFLILPFFVMIFSVFSTAALAQTATVTTDKPDYAPRSNAVFTGSGFQPNEDVVLKVKNLFRACNTVSADSSYLPWTVKADADGGFVTNWTVCDCLGDSLKLRATGQTSGLIAYAYFSDATNTNTAISSSSLNNTSVYGQIVTFTATVTQQGNGNAITAGTVNFFDVTASPAIKLNPSPISLDVTGKATFLTSLLTATTGGHTVQAFYNGTTLTNGNPDNRSSNASLVQKVNKATLTITANNQIVSYGTTEPIVTNAFGFTPSGFLNGDGASVINGSVTYIMNYTSLTPVGTSGLIITPVVTNLSATNYNFTPANGNITVTKATQNITWPTPSAITFGTALSATQLNASTLGDGHLTYTPASGTILNAGTQSLSVTAAETANYNSNTKQVTIEVLQATPSINVVVGGPYTYNGSAQGPNSANNTGTGTNYTFSYSGANGTSYSSSSTAPTNAGNYTVTATIEASADGNFKSTNSSATAFTIVKAASVTTVTITGAPFTYTGAAQTPASITVTGAGLTTLTPAPVYANNTNAGTATASYTYAGDANHFASDDSKEFVIGKAASVTTVTVINTTYDGNSHGGSASVTGTGSLSQSVVVQYVGVAPTVYTSSTTAPTNAGTYIASASYTGGTNHNGSNDSKNFTIGKALLVVTGADTSKYCGQANPVLTGNVIGLVGSEAFNITYSTTATQITGGASYPIVPNVTEISGGATLSNYTLIKNEGTLTVKALTSIDASASSQSVAINLPATLSASISPAQANVLVTFYLDGVEKGTSQTLESGIATLLLPKFTAAELYKVVAVAGSNCVAASTAGYLSIYDPTGGFVTGGGWLNSPAGAYRVNTSLTGKANFGFNAKYKKGSTVQVEGNTEFQFQAGSLNFASSSYLDSRLVIAGSKANFKGVGTINGVTGYSFMVSGIDGQYNGATGSDRFRIKIWETNGGKIVYDNVLGEEAENYDLTGSDYTKIGGGSIVIHETKKTNTQQNVTLNNAVPEVTDSKFGLTAFPNPTQNQFKLHVESSKRNQKIVLRVYDAYGRTVRLIRDATAGQTLTLGAEYRPGVYVIEMTQGTQRSQVKLVKAVY